MSKAISLIYSYATVGRNYPPMIAALEELLHERFDDVNTNQCSTLVWCCARLNNRSAPYLAEAVRRAMEPFIDAPNKLRQQPPAKAMQMLSRLLWSLSALQMLTLETFHAVRPLIERFASQQRGGEVHAFMANQLSQVWCEVQLLTKAAEKQAQGAKEVDATASAAWKVDGKEEEEVKEKKEQGKYWKSASPRAVSVSHANAKAGPSWSRSVPLPWQEGSSSSAAFAAAASKGVGIAADTESSKTHLEASRLLNEMGITHYNERVLNNGYIADTYIPAAALQRFFDDHARPDAAETSDIGANSDSNSNSDLNENADNGDVSLETAAGKKTDLKKMKVKKVAPLGMVLEFDGPFHFESHLQVSISICTSRCTSCIFPFCVASC